jgi:hypothetical protein
MNEFNELSADDTGMPADWRQTYADYPANTEAIGIEDGLGVTEAEQGPDTPEPLEDPAPEPAGTSYEQTPPADAEPSGDARPAGGADLPPPHEEPPVAVEDPDDVPAFGVKRFQTDPRYELDPPAPADLLIAGTANAFNKHALYAVPNIENTVEGEDLQIALELEHHTPEGKIDIGLSSAGVASMTFTDNDNNASHHVFYPAEEGTTQRYDPDVETQQSLAEQPTGTSPLESVPEDIIDAIAMDVEFGQGISVVGASQMEYVLDVLDKAEPVTVPARLISQAIEERQERETPVSAAETSAAYHVLAQHVAATLGDPESGYTLYQDGERVGGKQTVTAEDGNYVEVDIGVSIWPNSPPAPYVRITYTEPVAGPAPAGRIPYTKTPTQVHEIKYDGYPFIGAFLHNTVGGGVADGPRGEYAVLHEPRPGNAGLPETLMLRNFIRRPRYS